MDTEFLCPICGNNEYSLAHNIKSDLKEIPKGLTRNAVVDVKILKCKGCGLEFNESFLNGYDFESLYKKNSIYSKSNNYNNSSFPLYSQNVIRKILKLIPKKSNILEIGCFTGLILNELQKAGYFVHGAELDPIAAQKARQKNLDVLTGTVFDKRLNNKKYRLIYCIGVFEHIRCPNEFLSKVHSLLHPDGFFLMQFPNNKSFNAIISKLSSHNWDMYAESGHIFFYSKKNIQKILIKNNFELVKFETATILIRGKIPFLPQRNPKIESFIQKITKKKLVFFIYALFISFFDLFKTGDTIIIIAKKCKGLSRPEGRGIFNVNDIPPTGAKKKCERLYPTAASSKVSLTSENK